MNHDEGEYVVLTKESEENLDRSDTVLNTFNQWLLRARQLNIFHTTRMPNVPVRTINAHFVCNSNYGMLICDDAADTSFLTPKQFCHITHTSQQQGDLNVCCPTLTQSYFLGRGVSGIDLPSGPVIVGQHESPVIR